MKSLQSIHESHESKSSLALRGWLIAGALCRGGSAWISAECVCRRSRRARSVSFAIKTGGRLAARSITITNRELERSTSVFAAKDGSFRMPTLEGDLYDLRVRRVGYKDISETGISLKGHGSGLTLTMSAETDPNELAWQLPANRWTPLVLERLSNDTRREEFVRQCAYCHQQGSWATRVQRSDEDWHAIFIKMGRMGGTISPELQKELPAALNAAYDDKNYLSKLTEPEFVAPPAAGGPRRDCRHN